MTRGYLRLRFYADEHGTGRLVARAEANRFSGEGGAHFDTLEIERFAAKLGTFTLADQTSLAGGFWSKDKGGKLEQELLAIACYPIDATGHLGLQVRLSTELWPPARPESQHSVALEMTTTYETLRRFSHALLAVLHGEAEEAVLEGE